MDENLTRKASYRIPGAAALIGRVSNPSAQPGQNGGFSDGFLTNSCVDTCHSGQPGKSSDPKNPMKSKDYPSSEGFPPVPPSGPFGTDCASLCVFMGLFGSVVFLGVACWPILHGQFAWNPCGNLPFFCRGWVDGFEHRANPAVAPKFRWLAGSCSHPSLTRLPDRHHRSRSDWFVFQNGLARPMSLIEAWVYQPRRWLLPSTRLNSTAQQKCGADGCYGWGGF